MDIINYLDSISPLAFLDAYGYTAWIAIRDILAWVVSIASWVVFGVATFTITKYLKNMKQDEAGILLEGSQGNIFFSALSIRTGFHTNYESMRKNRPDISKEDALGKVTFRRALSLIVVSLTSGTFMAVIGAEWGIVALLIFCLRFLTADTVIRDYYYIYMDYLDEDFESRE